MYNCTYISPYAKNRGLLSSIQMKEGRKAHPRGPEPSATHLGYRALSTGVVDSLGDGFVYNINVLWLNNAIR